MPCCMWRRGAALSRCHAALSDQTAGLSLWTGRAGLGEGGLRKIRPALAASMLWKDLRVICDAEEFEEQDLNLDLKLAICTFEVTVRHYET